MVKKKDAAAEKDKNKINPEELLSCLKNKRPLDSKGLIVVLGEEDYYRKQIEAVIEDYVFQDIEPDSREVTVIEKNTDLREITAVINTYPFFCGQSLLILKDSKFFNLGKTPSEERKQQLDKLAELLADIPDYCTVFISAAKLDKRTKLYKFFKSHALLCECEELKPYNAQPWLEKLAAKYGAHLTYDAKMRLLEYLAPVDNVPMAIMEQEFAKLAVYTNGRSPWTVDDLEAVWVDLPEVSNFKLCDFISEKKLPQVLEMLSVMKQRKVPLILTCGLIDYHLRKLARFQELMQSSHDIIMVGKEMGLHPFIAKKMQQQCRNFSAASLIKAIIAVNQINLDSRGGGRKYEDLEDVMVQLLH